MTQAFGISQSPTPTVFYNGGGYMFSGNGGCGLTSSGAFNGGSQVSSSALYSFGVGDIIGIAFDSTTLNLWFRKNGTWISGDPALGTSPTMTVTSGAYYFSVSCYSCSIFSPAAYQYDVYPSVQTQIYAVPAGFTSYQP